jgi:uroporphyrinogen decarboxylase
MDLPSSNFVSPRQRVLTAMQHRQPDRVPVDFLATPEIWERLVAHFGLDGAEIDHGGYFSPEREAILRRLEVDCRLVSYDMFCAPPGKALRVGGNIDWWTSLARSTPNRMWRQLMPDGTAYDIWGHHTRSVQNPSGFYEEFASWPLRAAQSVAELAQYAWPQPDWWDFSALRQAIAKINPQQTYHLRFRAGTMFESAWQLRGMEEFLVDLASDPALPEYILDRITEVVVENTRRALETAGDLIDMVYFYDDMGAQTGLLISKNMWRKYIRPRHQKIIELAHSFGKPVMYHSDGAIYPLLAELIDLGVDVLDPLQPNARDMAPARLKAEFGERLAFHGGIDIVETLPLKPPAEVIAEVTDRVQVMGENGGYILASSHHIQPDTPLENVLAMYQVELRYRRS